MRKALPALAVLALSVLIIPRGIEAQRRPSDALILARITMHEAGADPSGDLEAIYEVLRAGAEREGMRFSTFAYAYAGRALRGETSRPWMAAGREDGRAPTNWPRVVTRRRGGVAEVVPHLPWARYADRWADLLERSRATVAGTRAHSCAAPPHDWGGRVDRARAARLGLIEVPCTDTRNDYYLRPSLLDDATRPE